METYIMRIKFYFALLALLSHTSTAQTIGPVTSSQISPAADTNSVVHRTLPPRVGGTISVLDQPGVRRDTRQFTSNVALSGGSTSFACTSCNFTVDDVGRYVVIHGAGATATSGAITAPSVTAFGNYTGQPSITVSGGGGQGAAVRPLMGVVSATVTSGGSGYPNGIVSLKLPSLACNAPGRINATVSRGVVTGIESISEPGACWNIDATGSTSLDTATATGSGAKVSVSWGVVSVGLMGGGWGYGLTPGAVTATVTGGTSTVTASLGPITVMPPVAPLATTIVAVASSTRASLASPIQTAVSGKRLITIGSDDTPAIQAAIARACTAGSRASVYLPGDGYGVASTIVLPDDCPGFDLEGSGRGVTNLYALTTPTIPARYAAVGAAPLPSMIFKGAFSSTEIKIQGLRLDANHIVPAPLFWHGGRGEIAGVKISNPAPGFKNGAGLIVGDPVKYYYTNSLSVTNLTVEDRVGVSTADLPRTGIAVHSPDNEFGNSVYVINTAIQGIYDGSSNLWIAPHIFNFPTDRLSLYSVTASGGRWVQPYLDSPIVAGFNRIGSKTRSLNLIAPYCYWNGGPGPTSACVRIGDGMLVSVDRPTMANPGVSGAQAVVQLGKPHSQSVITPALGPISGSYATGGYRQAFGGWSLSTADGSAVGGGARGAYAFDTQDYGDGICRSEPTQVAAGIGSITIGCRNAVSAMASHSVAIGNNNTADAPGAVVLGWGGEGRGRAGSMTFSGGRSATDVPHQSVKVLMGVRTTSTNPTRFWVNSSPGFQNSINIPTGSSIRLDIRVKCHDSAMTDFGTWHIPTVMFSRSNGHNFAAMTPSSTIAVFDAGTPVAQSGKLILENDTVNYPGPQIIWTAPNSVMWDCSAEADILE